jgi:hypothetical protein
MWCGWPSITSRIRSIPSVAREGRQTMDAATTAAERAVTVVSQSRGAMVELDEAMIAFAA